MQTTAGHIEPLFELKGRSNYIDLSAWISGLSFGIGIMFCDTQSVEYELLGCHTGLYVVAIAFAAFLASVMLIQRHMRLSLLANTFGSPRKLTTTGLFRYSRNPIYVAFFIPLASISYFSLSAAIAATGIYILAMNLTAIRKEERDLLSIFGTDYAEYLKSAPRWII